VQLLQEHPQKTIREIISLTAFWDNGKIKLTQIGVDVDRVPEFLNFYQKLISVVLAHIDRFDKCSFCILCLCIEMNVFGL